VTLNLSMIIGFRLVRHFEKKFGNLTLTLSHCLAVSGTESGSSCVTVVSILREKDLKYHGMELVRPLLLRRSQVFLYSGWQWPWCSQSDRLRLWQVVPCTYYKVYRYYTHAGTQLQLSDDVILILGHAITRIRIFASGPSPAQPSPHFPPKYPRCSLRTLGKEVPCLGYHFHQNVGQICLRSAKIFPPSLPPSWGNHACLDCSKGSLGSWPGRPWRYASAAGARAFLS